MSSGLSLETNRPFITVAPVGKLLFPQPDTTPGFNVLTCNMTFCHQLRCKSKDHLLEGWSSFLWFAELPNEAQDRQKTFNAFSDGESLGTLSFSCPSRKGNRKKFQCQPHEMRFLAHFIHHGEFLRFYSLGPTWSNQKTTHAQETSEVSCFLGIFK